MDYNRRAVPQKVDRLVELKLVAVARRNRKAVEGMTAVVGVAVVAGLAVAEGNGVDDADGGYWLD